MLVAIGSDHAGFLLKQELVPFIAGLGNEVLDLGTNSTAPVDYPDYAEAVGLAVRDGRVERGIMICGSGVGASVAADKIPGIRAGVCHDIYSAHQSVEHDDMNVLVLGSRVIGDELAKDLVAAYLRARFTGEERHRRRLAKVRAIEEQFSGRLRG
jgi:ribose 5-phosphate isomerase B